MSTCSYKPHLQKFLLLKNLSWNTGSQRIGLSKLLHVILLKMMDVVFSVITNEMYMSISFLTLTIL